MNQLRSIESQVLRILIVAVASVSLLAPVLRAQAPATAPADAAARGGRGAGGGGGANAANYPFPYRAVTPEQVAEVLQRVYAYVDANSASRMIDRTTNETITDLSVPNPNAALEQKMFNIVGYEWGVTYCGMIQAAQATGDPRYKEYVEKRLNLIAAALKSSSNAQGRGGAAGGRGGGGLNLRSMTSPGTLDDSGSMCVALIKARAAGVGPDLMSQIDTYIKWIHTGQFRFPDGTLARNRPHENTLWLDDLYMSVPALAHMGKLTGDRQYYDDACKQILQFASRMFVPETGLWAHGWTMKADEHPAFHWSRANGWAVMAMTELLEVLPEDHPQRPEIMKLYKANLRGLAKVQAGEGLWHQVLDRSDSYLETSGTAMFVYAFSRAVNRGWIDPITYGPVALLGWNALATKVNAQGQVEGTCVATDMAFDYAFYYYRPVSATAAHGYGPVLLAGAEVTNLVKNKQFRVQFQSLHLATTQPFGGGGGGGRRGQ
jgi:unsaturated rhamnogalacturonyl hydrolase